MARVAYAHDIDHVQASWVKLGSLGARLLLASGVDDLGGTLMDENISRAAGASHGQGLRPDELSAIARARGAAVAAAHHAVRRSCSRVTGDGRRTDARARAKPGHDVMHLFGAERTS